MPNPTVTLVQSKCPWKFIFLFAIWVIWQKRNFVVFQKKPFPLYLKSEISQRALEFVHCAQDAKEAVHYVLKPIKWEQVGPSTWLSSIPFMQWVYGLAHGAVSHDILNFFFSKFIYNIWWCPHGHIPLFGLVGSNQSQLTHMEYRVSLFF